MKYFKYRWKETRGDDFDDWGFSTFYIEIDEDLYPNRQIELYDNGNKLHYDNENVTDEFGYLGDKSIEEDTEKLTPISKEDFERVWNSGKILNR